MTPLPKRKLSKARSGKRRKSIVLNTVGFVSCPNCSQPKLPHRACQNCGFYNNKKVVDIKAPKKKVKS